MDSKYLPILTGNLIYNFVQISAFILHLYSQLSHHYHRKCKVLVTDICSWYW